MYRKRNGSRSFSFSRLVLNAVPNFATSWEPGTIDITPQRQDTLYAHQMSKGWPECLNLNESSFYWAGCCDRERQSERMFVALLKNGVLAEREVPPTPSGSGVNGAANGGSGAVNGDAGNSTITVTIDTSKISSKFIHQLAFISQTSQKNLINVIFFWEEEVQRLKKLDAEESEISDLIRTAERRSRPARQTMTESAQTPAQPTSDRQQQPNKDQEQQTHQPSPPPRSSSPTPDQRAELDRLRFARERVRMKKRQVPTQRDPDIERDTDNVLARAFSVGIGMDGTPARGMGHVLGGGAYGYYGGGGGVGVGGGLGQQRENAGAGGRRMTEAAVGAAQSEMPPAYRASISC